MEDKRLFNMICYLMCIRVYIEKIELFRQRSFKNLKEILM